uniref:YHYH domain-containing protein n=1 Tax=Bicosoecida sp. CB-2014 TaxID=1486930 RepID=A0A7S1G3J0_9STRA|mmetsp:Transcript_12341/g.43230  ORF Transcript_12341/g.43230 Transcript_12341/m.43230 type:complete len:834 (+) Transcript_12341:412-2913(+)
MAPTALAIACAALLLVAAGAVVPATTFIRNPATGLLARSGPDRVLVDIPSGADDHKYCGLALDTDDSRVFWSDGTAVHRAALDGSGQEVVVPTSGVVMTVIGGVNFGKAANELLAIKIRGVACDSIHWWSSRLVGCATIDATINADGLSVHDVKITARDGGTSLTATTSQAVAENRVLQGYSAPLVASVRRVTRSAAPAELAFKPAQDGTGAEATGPSKLQRCWTLAAQFRNTCPGAPVSAAVSVADMTGTQVTCSGVGECPVGGVVGDDGSCSWWRRLCVTCRDDAGTVRVRVQSNGLPDHCFGSPHQAPAPLDIDYEVEFDADVDDPAHAPTTGAEIDALLCDLQRTADANVPASLGFTKLGATDLTTTVGVALNGVPMLNGLSADGVDPFYPPAAFGGASGFAAEAVDQCVAHPTAQGAYHAHMMSPCLFDGGVDGTKPCTPAAGCADVKSHALAGYAGKRAVTAVGISKDGHQVLGPYDASGELWQGVDVCNGRDVDGSYSFVATTTFPYFSGCFGGGNHPGYSPSCSANAAEYAPSVSDEEQAAEAAAAAVGPRLFWSDHVTGLVVSTDPDGGTFKVLATGAFEVFGLAYDAGSGASGSLLYSNADTGEIVAVDLASAVDMQDTQALSGADVARVVLAKPGGTVVLSGLDRPRGIAVDAPNGMMYFTEASGRIYRARVDGRNLEANPLRPAVYARLLLERGSTARMDGIAVTQGADGSFPKSIYWTETNTNSVWRASVYGSSPQRIAGSRKETVWPRAICLLHEAGNAYAPDAHLFWTQYLGRIHRASGSGAGRVAIVDTLSGASGYRLLESEIKATQEAHSHFFNAD